MRVAFAGLDDLDFLAGEDHHVDREVIREKVARREIMVAYVEHRPVGFLRHGYLWDEIPFMNLLWVEEESRGKDYGTQLVASWESEMRKLGHDSVMTSSLYNERVQHLYRRLGYADVGSLNLHRLPQDP